MLKDSWYGTILSEQDRLVCYVFNEAVNQECRKIVWLLINVIFGM